MGALPGEYMRRLLERNITSIERRLVLLAPPQGSVPPVFNNVTVDAGRRHQLIRDMQRLRGQIYLHDGALQPQQLSPDGLHQTPEDEQSWHLLMLNKDNDVTACAWYLEHDNTTTIEKLRLRNCPLGRVDGWRDKLRHAVESEVARARRDRLRYAEVGGWAVSKESRCTSEGLMLALAAYSLGRILGGALGITTATVRHSSSTILRRLGGSHLELDGEAVPPYYDPKYDCEMELLRFDSRRPSAKYASLIEMLKGKLSNVSVFTEEPLDFPAPEQHGFLAVTPHPQFAA
jgi:hypothetical protein